MSDTKSASDTATQDALRIVSEALERLRYGAISLTVHDTKVVQLEITEKHRLSG